MIPLARAMLERRSQRRPVPTRFRALDSPVCRQSPYSGRAFAVADQAQRRTSPVSGFAMRTRPRTTSASEADLKRRVLGLGRTGREQRVLDLGLLQPADHMVDHLAHRAAEIGEQALLLGRGVADKEAGAVTEIRT